jgi:Flp pilus assembly pilin Flp
LLLATLGANLMLKFFAVIQNCMADRLSGDRGASAVEYGLLVTLIAGTIAFAVFFLGLKVAFWFLRVLAGF